MSLEDIKTKILSDAGTQAERIAKDTEAKITQIKSATQAEIADNRKKKLITIKQKALNTTRSVLISAMMTKKNALLKKKRQILDKVFSQVIQKLADLNDEKYQKILAWQMQKLTQINLGKPTIIAPQGKSELIKNVANKILGDNNFQISDNETDKIKSGFIVKSSETKIDFSFSNLIKEIKPTIEGKVSKILF